MPCIQIKTNQSLTKDTQLDCCHSISAKTAALLAKPESYVMVILETEVSMTMSGTIDAAAYVELKSINLPEEQTSELSAELCQLISTQLKVDSKRIYIEFSNAQRHLWGWDGKTF